MSGGLTINTKVTVTGMQDGRSQRSHYDKESRGREEYVMRRQRLE